MQTVLTRGYAPRATQSTLFGRLRLWLDLWSERRALAQLDRRMLADLGIDADAAMLEASRPMWDVPRLRDAGRRYGYDR
ncbi:MAG: DUF1127 domain-containing protein [Acuticoccus sp.]